MYKNLDKLHIQGLLYNTNISIKCRLKLFNSPWRFSAKHKIVKVIVAVKQLFQLKIYFYLTFRYENVKQIIL